MSAQETLYNGIVLPADWPPRYEDPRSLGAVPYLRSRPPAASIDVGRQLFVDDFLIEDTDLERAYGRPAVRADGPVLFPQTEEELDNGNCPMAAPFNDGCWYDPADGLYKMWYMPGWFHTTALAVSREGLVWERPRLDVVSGTNLVWPPREGCERDGCLVWLDHDAADPGQRFKMFQYYRIPRNGAEDMDGEGWLQTSADGVHWSAPVVTTAVGDNTSFFYNPFRRKWCMSIRRNLPRPGMTVGIRSRWYAESDGFLQGAQWDRERDEVLWQMCDERDLPDPAWPDHTVALYDLNVTPYESILVGMFAVFRGPENHICEKLGVPKTIDLEVGYSRDGFHFSRPDRTPFLASSRREGTWNRAYLHAVGGLFLVVGDELRFYFTGFSGESPRLGVGEKGSPGRSRYRMYAGASVGLATLRRDGFASLRAGSTPGTVTTRPLLHDGEHLFVNTACLGGELRVELLDESGRPIAGFGRKDCVPVRVDSTRHQVRWKDKERVPVSGRPVRLRFHLSRGDLYSFWLATDTHGRSRGFAAAGGPGFGGASDT